MSHRHLVGLDVYQRIVRSLSGTLTDPMIKMMSGYRTTSGQHCTDEQRIHVLFPPRKLLLPSMAMKRLIMVVGVGVLRQRRL